MKPQALLFDMDGTLTDSEALWFESEVNVFKDFGIEWVDGYQNDIIGMAIEDSTSLLVKRHELPLTPKELSDLLVAEVVRLGTEKGMPWRPGAERLLELSVELGIPSALVTSSFREFADLTLANAPEGSLTTVITGDVVPSGFGKPHPKPYLMAADELGVDINACLAFEDSRPGVQSAHASGATPIAIPFHVAIPDLDGVKIVDSLEAVTEEYLLSVLSA